MAKTYDNFYKIDIMDEWLTGAARQIAAKRDAEIANIIEKVADNRGIKRTPSKAERRHKKAMELISRIEDALKDVR